MKLTSDAVGVLAKLDDKGPQYVGRVVRIVALSRDGRTAFIDADPDDLRALKAKGGAREVSAHRLTPLRPALKEVTT